MERMPLEQQQLEIDGLKAAAGGWGAWQQAVAVGFLRAGLDFAKSSTGRNGRAASVLTQRFEALLSASHGEIPP